MYFVTSSFTKKNVLKNVTPLKLKVLILKSIPVCLPVQLGKNLHSQVEKSDNIQVQIK